jgi:hypothetical protein
LAGSAHDGHEAQDAVDAGHDGEATEGQAGCDDTHRGTDGDADRDDDDGPNEDPDHTADAGHGAHHQDDTSEHGASCGTTETSQNSDPAGDPAEQTATQQQADAEDPACAAVAVASAADDGEEHSHRGRDRSGNEGTHGHDDELSALLSSDTLVWKEASAWCAESAMSPGAEQPDLVHMGSLLEACRDDGFNASQPGDDGALAMHTNALLGMQPDHGWQTL